MEHVMQAEGGPRPDRSGRYARLRLSLACTIAVLAGHASRALSRGSGRTVPGALLMRWAPDVISDLASGHRLVLISGTNGKTTTTRMLARALSDMGPVITNDDGANLTSGIVSALLAARREPPGVAVLEVDEVALVRVLEQTRPVVLVLLNLSRDQLDRTSEVRSHIDRWGTALADTPHMRIVANADDPLVVAAVLRARPRAVDVTWVAAGKAYREDESLCPRCGRPWNTSVASWRCDHCGLATPLAAWRVEHDQVWHHEHAPARISLALPGRVNVANALMAVAAAAELGVLPERSLELLSTLSDIAGRYRQVSVRGQRIRLLLAKNPAGWLESLDHIDGHSAPVLISVNSRDADGLDPSWLWDVPFERLRGRQVIALGDRVWDLSVRLLYAEVEHQVASDELSALSMLPPGECDLVANYTAFVRASAVLGATR